MPKPSKAALQVTQFSLILCCANKRNFLANAPVTRKYPQIDKAGFFVIARHQASLQYCLSTRGGYDCLLVVGVVYERNG